MDYLYGTLAGISATLVSNPLDLIKTRLQLQGELKKKGEHVILYKNAFHAMYLIGKKEGILALQKGLVPALMFHGLLNGIRFGLYTEAHKKGWDKNSDGQISTYKIALISGLTGIIGNYAGSPFYLVKTQIQTKAPKEIAVGFQHQHEGTFSALRNIYRKGGIKGLWRGSTAAVPRVAIATSGQISIFITGKEFLAKHQILSENESSSLHSVVISAIGGLVVATLMTPFDVVQTRLYNQGVGKDGKGLLYNGILDCFAKIIRTEGIAACWKGFTSCYLRVGPHSMVTLIVWDLLRNKQKKDSKTKKPENTK